MIQEDPEQVRQLILESGMSESEIRARLASMGLPTNALDQFLGPTAAGASTELNPAALAALESIGVIAAMPDGVAPIPVTTGMRLRLTPADSVEGLPIFGLNVFSRATTQFQPLLYGPVPDEYRLGPGDQMVLVLTGEIELARELVVTREGFLVVPQIGQIQVANLTQGQLRGVLEERLGRAYSGIARGTTRFDITVTQLRTIQVYLSGEITQPGAYQLASVATVMNALYAAGGPTSLGNLREIQVRRRTGETVVLDLYPYLLSGDLSGDVGLEQGDAIFVPLTGRRVGLAGRVGRPARYELSETDDLVDVFRAAGGFAPDADRRRITIHRVSRPDVRGPGISDRVAIDFGLTASSDPTADRHVGGVIVPPIGLQDGDSIVVDAVPALSDAYFVSVTGMVAQPDTFPWREGITIRDVILLARGPTVGADLREAEVSRLPEDRTAGELAERLRVALDSSYLSQRDPDGRYVGARGIAFPPAGSSPEFVLEPFDQVLVLRQPDFEMPRTVKITGQVRVPGEYTLLTKDDRLGDLVERANGLLPTAYPEGARLVRSQDELGRIDIDLPQAVGGRRGDQDLVLQAGDSLHIPVYSPTVVVRGAVNSPVTVLYRAGERLDYYIANAGGFSHIADKGRTSVRFANGQAQTRSRFLLWSSYPIPGPGSVVTVPAEDPGGGLDVRGLIADVVAITGSLATVIIVLTR
jgi:protein involved in polysaccharide export with SLBB domain